MSRDKGKGRLIEDSPTSPRLRNPFLASYEEVTVIFNEQPSFPPGDPPAYEQHSTRSLADSSDQHRDYASRLGAQAFSGHNGPPKSNHRTSQDHRHHHHHHHHRSSRGTGRSHAKPPSPPPPREPEPPFDESQQIDPNFEVAIRLQQAYDVEHILLQRQIIDILTQEELELQFLERLQEAEKGFSCGICMDDLPMSDVMKVNWCGHELCRECLRGYVETEIDARKHPIICPLCAADRNRNRPRGSQQAVDNSTGVVTDDIIQLLGISEDRYRIFEELQLVEFSVPILCRKCNRTSNLDRGEFQSNAVLLCPLPDCNHSWCKMCSQAIEQTGPAHSCDGTNEFNHLLQQQNWKRCPRCQTPIERISGCNNMVCSAPACGVPFCYSCGRQKPGCNC